MPSYRPVGQCIYCGEAESALSDEHIIPYSLNGILVLPKASCSTCAGVTSRSEREVARSMYGLLRVKRGFKTRRKNSQPTSAGVGLFDQAGEKRITLLPIDQVPTLYGALELPPPGILSGAPRTESNPELKIHLKGDESEMAAAAATLGADTIALKVIVEWRAFARLLAKIAHSYLVATVGLRGYTPLLPDLILGRSLHLSHYVGGAVGALQDQVGDSDVTLVCQEAENEPHLTVYVQLLGRGRLPIYLVVAARVIDGEEVARGVRNRA